jgi:hypothetical protein
MRLWSLHPSLLDRQGLLAAWREGLLAQSVIASLENYEKPGYANHPQLKRFLASPVPLLLIGTWLTYIQEDATERGYRFDKSKIQYPEKLFRLTVTSGQLDYEFGHLQSKLKERSNNDYQYNRCYYQHSSLPTHPMFEVIPGDIEDWEKIK